MGRDGVEREEGRGIEEGGELITFRAKAITVEKIHKQMTFLDSQVGCVCAARANHFTRCITEQSSRKTHHSRRVFRMSWDC